MSSMAGPTTTKLNRLEQDLPEGLLVDSGWLEAKQVNKQLRNYYVHNGWLQQIAHGVFARTRGPLKWQQVVISLQTILLSRYPPFVVGGSTALELQGFAHYVSRDIREVHLYGPEPPPTWLKKMPVEQSFKYHSDRRLFRNDPIHRGLTSMGTRDLSYFQGDEVVRMPWGQWDDWTLTLSTPERAALELLDELPARESFQNVDKVMEGLSNLRPQRLQKLLVDCDSVKVKRLFFFFADRHKHAWLKRLDKSRVDFGSGKRMIAKEGRLDPTYQITVPKDLDGHQ